MHWHECQIAVDYNPLSVLSIDTPEIISYSVTWYRLFCVTRTQLMFKLYLYLKLKKYIEFVILKYVLDTGSLKHNAHWDSDNFSVSSEILNSVMKPKDHYCVQKIPPLVPLLSQLKLSSSHTSFCKFHNIFLQSVRSKIFQIVCCL